MGETIENILRNLASAKELAAYVRDAYDPESDQAPGEVTYREYLLGSAVLCLVASVKLMVEEEDNDENVL